jgi:hypothetical protein
VLSGILFEEEPPPHRTEPAPDFPAGQRLSIDPGAKYVLHAYFSGKRYTTSANEQGDWYDLPAVVGLLNYVLRDAGSPVRFVALDMGGQDAALIAGRIDALAWLSNKRLLEYVPIGAGAEHDLE